MMRTFQPFLLTLSSPKREKLSGIMYVVNQAALLTKVQSLLGDPESKILPQAPRGQPESSGLDYRHSSPSLDKGTRAFLLSLRSSANVRRHQDLTFELHLYNG